MTGASSSAAAAAAPAQVGPRAAASPPPAAAAPRGPRDPARPPPPPRRRPQDAASRMATYGCSTSRCTQLINVAGFEMYAVSVAGQETSITLPREKVVFDIGRCPQRAVSVETVLISHAHMDHIGGINFHLASRQMLSLTPSRVFLPSANVGSLHQLCEVHRALDGCDMRVDAAGVDPGAQWEHRGDLLIRAFPTTHVVPSQGYLVLSRRKKLRPEYRALAGSEIRALKERGVDVTAPVDAPEVAFTGDTDISFVHKCLRSDPAVLRARLLIMELTFVDDLVDPENARSMGHTHVRDLLDNIEHFRDVGHVLLIHFSARYKARQVVAELEARLPDWFQAKTSLLLEGYAD